MFDKIGKFIKKAVENNLNFILGIGIVGIIMAIVGHYGTVGFNWTMFLCFELPLYIFVGWSFYHIFKILNIIKKSKK